MEKTRKTKFVNINIKLNDEINKIGSKLKGRNELLIEMAGKLKYV